MEEQKKDVIRVTFDLPMQLHKSLKIKAACDDTSMREIVVKALEEKVQNGSAQE